jgi:P27 family predicted phage terminase small subunit
VLPASSEPAKRAPAKKATVAIVEIPEAFPPPRELPEVMHGTWRAIIQDLGSTNHMRDTYLPAITAYVEAWWIHQEASANIHQFGVLVKGPSGPQPNPLIRVQKEAAATMLRYADVLGLTPAGKIRLGLMEITGMSLLSSLNQALDGN